MPKRTLEQNAERRYRYKLVYELTGNSTLARRARDITDTTKFAEVLRPYIKSDKKDAFKKFDTQSTKLGKSKKSKVSTKLKKSELNTIFYSYPDSNTRRRAFYKLARAKGYTPKEADRLKGYNPEKFKKFINSGQVLDPISREKRWEALSRKGYQLDDNLIDLAEQINMDNGFSPTARYGYGIVYAWYVTGGDIKDFIYEVKPDPMIPDIYYGLEEAMSRKR